MFGLGSKKRNQEMDDHIAQLRGPKRPATSAGSTAHHTTAGIDMSDSSQNPTRKPSGRPLEVNVAPGYRLDCIPEGVTMKRIFTRASKSGNRWRVTYQGRSQEYYGQDLGDAFHEFFKNHNDVHDRYLDNLKG